MMDPKRLKKWLIIIAVLYLVFPRDLIPDFLGSGLGLIDDLVLIALLIYFYRTRVRDFSARAGQGSTERDQREHSSGGEAEGSDSSPDPYQILSIDSSASRRRDSSRLQSPHA